MIGQVTPLSIGNQAKPSEHIKVENPEDTKKSKNPNDTKSITSIKHLKTVDLNLNSPRMAEAINNLGLSI